MLIADDEVLVRLGLRTTIDWEKNGFVIVGEAKNGEEAVELFNKYNADILITDIRMPVIDGLEVIRRIKEKKKDLKSIILTHYDEFSYAQKAVKIGATEFILKTDLSPDNLLNTLKKISGEIIPARKDDLSNLIKTDYLYYALEKAILSDISKIEYEKLINEDHGKVFKNFFVAYAKIFNNEDLDYDISKNDFFKNLPSIYIRKENVRQAMMIIDNHLCYLYNIDFKTEYYDKEQEDIIEILNRNLKQFFDLDLFFGISSIGSKIYDIPRLLTEAKTACERCFFSEKKVIHYNRNFEEIGDENIKIKPHIVRSYVDDANMEEIYKYIDEQFDKAYRTFSKTGVRKLFIDFISLAKLIYQERFAKEEIINDEKFRYIYFDKIADFNAVKMYIKGIYNFIVTLNEEKGYSHYINESIKYIKLNYEKNISLEDVAEYSQISKTYLSLLFKQETGINLSTFLTNYRIEKSKELMKESYYKIYEIAEKVGFDNPYYFSRVFKEKTGISCKEFQKKHLR